MIETYIPYAVAVALIVTSLIDLRTGRIPNWMSLVLIAMFAVLVLQSPEWTPYMWQLGYAVGAFALGMLLYAFLGFGAGAVKLLFGVALFLPMSRPWATLGILFLSLFISGLIVTLVRGKWGKDDSKWKVMAERVMPLSLPMTVTSLLAMFWLQA